VTKATPASFWAKVIKTDGCWLWRGAHFKKSGYSRVKYHGRDTCAHIIAWELTHGPVPDWLELDHLCRHRPCVNPAHLEPVTPFLNQVRGNTFTARKAAQTHCEKGHALVGDNLFIRRDGHRRCQACEKISQKKLRGTDAYRARHAEYERHRRALKKESQ